MDISPRSLPEAREVEAIVSQAATQLEHHTAEVFLHMPSLAEPLTARLPTYLAKLAARVHRIIGTPPQPEWYLAKATRHSHATAFHIAAGRARTVAKRAIRIETSYQSYQLDPHGGERLSYPGARNCLVALHTAASRTQYPPPRRRLFAGDTYRHVDLDKVATVCFADATSGGVAAPAIAGGVIAGAATGWVMGHLAGGQDTIEQILERARELLSRGPHSGASPHATDPGMLSRLVLPAASQAARGVWSGPISGQATPYTWTRMVAEQALRQDLMPGRSDVDPIRAAVTAAREAAQTLQVGHATRQAFSAQPSVGAPTSSPTASAAAVAAQKTVAADRTIPGPVPDASVPRRRP